MTSFCTYPLIKGSLDSCAYAREHCNNQDVIPFTHLYFCTLDDEWPILLGFTPIFMFVVFHFLSKSADDYLAPAVQVIAEYFKLSQTLAGVTLIAFSNGAPDVLAAFIASGNEEGVLIAIGSIFGSALFMTTFIFGCVIYYSNFIKADQVSLNRDLTFNLISVSLIIIFAYVGYINYIMAFLFALVYTVYIGIVLFNENTAQIQQEEENSKPRIDEQESQGLLNEESDQQDDMAYKNCRAQIDNDSENNIAARYKLDNQRDSDEEVSQEFEEMTILHKLWCIYATPMQIIRTITIPVSIEDNYDKSNTILQCILSPLVMLYLLQSIDITIFGINILLIVYVFSMILLILVLLNKVPMILLAILSTVCSIIWSKFCVQCMIDFLLLIQVITGLSYSYLGMTFLAFGNSACDLLVNTKLAQMGLGLMALTGCFSGTIFNIFMGFGSALIRQTWIDQPKGSIQFDLFGDSNNYIAFYLLIFFMINIFVTYLLVRIVKYQLTYGTSIFYILEYCICFVVITGVSMVYDDQI